MKQISFSLFMLLFLLQASPAVAQVPVANTGLYAGGYLGYAWASPDGRRIMMTLGDNSGGSFVIWNIGAGEMPFLDKNYYQDVIAWSPSGKYVATYPGNGGKDPQGHKREYHTYVRCDTFETRDLQTAPHVFEHRSAEGASAYMDDHILGITDKGWIITTKASKRDKAWTTREIYKRYTGIRICHPQVMDSFIVVTDDIIKETDKGGACETIISDDGGAVYSYSIKYPDNATVQCWPLTAGAKQSSFKTGMRTIAPGWWSDALAILPNDSTNYFETYDTRTGALLAADSNLTRYGRLFIRHHRIFRYDKRSYQMEELVPKDGHLVIASAVKLDTTGLHLSANMPYRALLLNEEKWILLPAGNNSWGPAQYADIKSGKANNAVLVSLRTGKPLAIYQGFFSGDMTQGYSNAEMVRAEAVKKSLAWGTAAGRDNNEKPEFYIPGEYIGTITTNFTGDNHFTIYDKYYYVLNSNAIDHTYNLLYYENGHTQLHTHVTINETSSMQRGIPPFYLCSACAGRGRKLEKEVVQAWNAWVDESGKVIYTRDERYDKVHNVDKVCRRCHGSGWTKEP